MFVRIRNLYVVLQPQFIHIGTVDSKFEKKGWRVNISLDHGVDTCGRSCWKTTYSTAQHNQQRSAPHQALLSPLFSPVPIKSVALSNAQWASDYTYAHVLAKCVEIKQAGPVTWIGRRARISTAARLKGQRRLSRHFTSLCDGCGFRSPTRKCIGNAPRSASRARVEARGNTQSRGIPFRLYE